MKKSIFSILLATVLTTSVILGGCGSKDAGSSNDSSASSGDTIKLGQQCDLSGDMANPAGMLGAQLAVKEINRCRYSDRYNKISGNDKKAFASR